MEENLEGVEVKLLTEGFTPEDKLLYIPQRLSAAWLAGYETEFMSGKHEFPANAHLRDCYEMGVEQCRDEVMRENGRHG